MREMILELYNEGWSIETIAHLLLTTIEEVEEEIEE